MKFTAVIVEDEPLARKTLRDLTADVSWLDVIGEAADGLAAVELINSRKPDLVFLDVNMPELSGLDVLKRLLDDPAVIFTTAYDRHAIAASQVCRISLGNRMSATSIGNSTAGFIKQLEQTDLGNLLDMPNDELMQAGNGTGELGAWFAVAGSMRGRLFTTLTYEPIYEWINGMGVVTYDPDPVGAPA